MRRKRYIMSGKSFAVGMGVGTLVGLMGGVITGIAMTATAYAHKDLNAEKEAEESFKDAEERIRNIQEQVEADMAKMEN